MIPFLRPSPPPPHRRGTDTHHSSLCRGPPLPLKPNPHPSLFQHLPHSKATILSLVTTPPPPHTPCASSRTVVGDPLLSEDAEKKHHQLKKKQQRSNKKKGTCTLHKNSCDLRGGKKRAFLFCLYFVARCAIRCVARLHQLCTSEGREVIYQKYININEPWKDKQTNKHNSPTTKKTRGKNNETQHPNLLLPHAPPPPPLNFPLQKRSTNNERNKTHPRTKQRDTGGGGVSGDGKEGPLWSG